MGMAEMRHRIFSALRLRIVAPTILRSFVAACAVLGAPIAAATTNLSDSKSTIISKTIAERIDTVRVELAKDGQLPTQFRNSSQKLTQWFNWSNFWNNWSNYWNNY